MGYKVDLKGRRSQNSYVDDVKEEIEKNREYPNINM